MGRDMAARLERYADVLSEEPPPADRLLPGAIQPTDTHRRLMDLMDTIMDMGTGLEGDGSSGHVMLKASLRTVRKLRPVALEELAKVPEDEILRFMGGLTEDMARSVGLTTRPLLAGRCPHCGEALET